MNEKNDNTSTSELTLLDRFLRLFSDVRSGESVTVLLMLVNIFLVLVCYYVIKTIREPLILVEGGAVGKSYSSAGQAMVLMAQCQTVQSGFHRQMRD